ncbi:MAG TPA: gamma-glutamyl-gamma-aminobutyrate hydrolase family protein [Pseudogracilibacillus sp.]|nr:gamma-glutamyl-gamma-aminobutyrate hydrolase family protein [Pseudogracilibacillus sp.]
MKPIIGITPIIDKEEQVFSLNRAHVNAVVKSGGIPVILPYTNRVNTERIAQQLDGLYLTGGYDIDPHLFKEEPHPRLGRIEPLRDRFELTLLHRFIKENKPVFGVCRGAQVINVALGGTMYQDLSSQKKAPLIQHRQTRPLKYPSHYVYVKEDSLIYQIVKERRILVNSNHHQANWTLGKNVVASARSEDGVIEAIEVKEHPFIIGVQWHPERLLIEKDKVSKRLYSYFIKKAIERRS